jgi:hypothetical protein
MDAPIQYSGPTTTAQSEMEGRLKVDAGIQKKKSVLKKHLKQITNKKV